LSGERERQEWQHLELVCGRASLAIRTLTQKPTKAQQPLVPMGKIKGAKIITSLQYTQYKLSFPCFWRGFRANR